MPNLNLNILFEFEFYTIQRLIIFGLGESVFHKDRSAKSFTKLAFIDKSYDGLKFQGFSIKLPNNSIKQKSF